MRQIRLILFEQESICLDFTLASFNEANVGAFTPNLPLLLGSPMLMDPHPSKQHVAPQRGTLF